MAGDQLVIRGGVFFWVHWLMTYGFLLGMFLSIGIGVAVGSFAVGCAVAGVWTLAVLIAGTRVCVRVEAHSVTINNGWYSRRFATRDVSRITLQNLPMAGGGRGGPLALAVWTHGREGWPALATTSFSDDRREAIAHDIARAVGRRGLRNLHLVNRGWRPSSFSRRVQIRRL